MNNQENNNNSDIKLALHKELIDNIISTDSQNFKAVIGMGQSTLRSSLIVNAGATIALLAFFSNNIIYILDCNEIFLQIAKQLLYAIVSFAIGTGLSCIAHGLTYLTQRSVHENFCEQVNSIKKSFWNDEEYYVYQDNKTINLDRITLVFVVASYLCIFIGIAFSYFAFIAALYR